MPGTLGAVLRSWQVQFDTEASQTRPFGRLRSLRAGSEFGAARPGPSLRKESLLRMTKQRRNMRQLYYFIPREASGGAGFSAHKNETWNGYFA